MDTRLNELVRTKLLRISREWRFTSRMLPILLFLVLLGFSAGSLASTTLPDNRWSGSVIFVLLVLFETMSALYYGRKDTFERGGPIIWLQYTKLGFVLGLFVDAFKVGS